MRCLACGNEEKFIHEVATTEIRHYDGKEVSGTELQTEETLLITCGKCESENIL